MRHNAKMSGSLAEIERLARPEWQASYTSFFRIPSAILRKDKALGTKLVAQGLCNIMFQTPMT